MTLCVLCLAIVRLVSVVGHLVKMSRDGPWRGKWVAGDGGTRRGDPICVVGRQEPAEELS